MTNPPIDRREVARRATALKIPYRFTMPSDGVELGWSSGWVSYATLEEAYEALLIYELDRID